MVATRASFRHDFDNDDYVDVGDHHIVEEVITEHGVDFHKGSLSNKKKYETCPFITYNL